MSPAARVERRTSLVVVVAAVLVFGILLTIIPPLFQTFDEAKYVGIGVNVLAGRGVVSVYGPFLAHSPLWAVTLAVPNKVAGVDPYAWGHLLDGIAGIGLILLSAWFAWRYRPAAGALTAVAMLGFTYLHDLTRTARLDVPAASLALLYLAIGLTAVRRGSIRWGLLAGVVFALAFLVKEIALPFAPVPFLAGLIAGRRLTDLARVGGATLIAAMVGTAWWFVVFASYTHQIYRLGMSDAYLGPLAVVVAGVALAGLLSERIAATGWARSIAASVERLVGRASRAWRRPIGWTLALVWFVALLVSFSANQGVRGLSLFSLAQYRLYAATWVSPITIIASAYALGALATVWTWLRHRLGRSAEVVSDIVLALLCSAPLVLLVIAVGEPPRNYFAQIGLVVGLASIGWTWIAGRVGTSASVRKGLESIGGSPLAATLVGLLIGVLVGAVAAYGIDRAAHVTTTRAAIAAGALLGAAVGTVLGIASTRWRRLRRPGGAALASPPGEPDRRQGLLVAGLVVPLVVAAALLTTHAVNYRESASGVARATLIGKTTDWIAANIPLGSKIAFGSFLGYEMNVPLQGRYPTVQIAQTAARFTPGAPLGIGVLGKAPIDDWMSVDIAPRNIAEFQAFRRSVTMAALQRGVDYWVYSTGTTTSAPTILAALTPDHGFNLVGDWSVPVPSSVGKPPKAVLHSYVFKIDPSRLAFEPGRMFVAPDAAERLIAALEQDPAGSRATAGAILDQIEITPTGPETADLLARLHRLAGR